MTIRQYWVHHDEPLHPFTPTPETEPPAPTPAPSLVGTPNTARNTWRPA